MEDKERKPYPPERGTQNSGIPMMGCVYFGPQTDPVIPNTLLGYAGPKPCPDPVTGFSGTGTATPSEVQKPQNSVSGEYAVCKTCGAKIPKKAKFCSECGAVNESR